MVGPPGRAPSRDWRPGGDCGAWQGRRLPGCSAGRRNGRNSTGCCGKRSAAGGTTLWLVGPEGSGRRRLLDETLAGWIAGRDDVVVLGGEAVTGPGRGRGEPFADTLRDWLLRGDPADSPQAQARLVGRLMATTAMDETEAGWLAATLCGQEPGLAAEVRAELMVRALLAVCTDGNRTLVLRVDGADEPRYDGTAGGRAAP